MVAIHHAYPAELALGFETTPGTPIDDWVDAETEGDAARMAFTEAEPHYIRGTAAVENAEHQADVYAEAVPLQGLHTADGGTIKCYLHGAEVATTAGEQLAATWQGKLLKHALGGGAWGYATTVAAVTSQTVFEVTSAEGIEVGHILALADVDSPPPQRLFPVQVLAVDGTEVTTDRAPPFALAVGDVVHPTEMAWPDYTALTNPEDLGYSTIAALYRRGNRVWAGVGGHLSFNELALERGGHPTIGFGIMLARGMPPGDGAPAWPAFTTTVGRSRTLPIGRDTKLFLQAKGTTTWSSHHVWSCAFTPGVPVVGNDTVTEVDTNMQGRAGYRADRGQTQLEVDVVLDPQRYTDWQAGQRFTVTYMQVAPAGKGWAIHMRDAFLAESPELVSEGSMLYKLRLRATVDEAATAAALKAKFVIARF